VRHATLGISAIKDQHDSTTSQTTKAATHCAPRNILRFREIGQQKRHQQHKFRLNKRFDASMPGWYQPTKDAVAARK
jgi:hypothetical protein